MVLLAGEAGIGKSRICMALASRVATEGHFVIRLQCSPFHTHSALHPIITNFERLAGLTLDMEPEEKLESLDRRGAEVPAMWRPKPLRFLPTCCRYLLVIACRGTKRRRSR